MNENVILSRSLHGNITSDKRKFVTHERAIISFTYFYFKTAKGLDACHCSSSYHFHLFLGFHRRPIISCLSYLWLISTNFRLQNDENLKQDESLWCIIPTVYYMEQVFTVECSYTSSAFAVILFIVIRTFCFIYFGLAEAFIFFSDFLIHPQEYAWFHRQP